jgi:hypothetical protein
MRCKVNEATIKDALKLYKTGMTMTKILEVLGLTNDKLSKELRLRGIDTRANQRKQPSWNKLALNLPPKLADLYHEGMSVLALSKKYRVTRHCIRLNLLHLGVKKIRNCSEGMYTRMEHTPLEGRKAQTAAANKTLRKYGQPPEQRIKLAAWKARTFHGHHIGRGELELIEKLRNRGAKPIHQAPFEDYNIDILVDGTVAVELFTATCNLPKRKGFLKRTKKLLEGGYTVIAILGLRKNVVENYLDQVVSQLDVLRQNPPTRRQYGVIRCHIEYTAVRNKMAQFTNVHTPKNFICTTEKVDL